MHRSSFVDYKVTNARDERAKEAAEILSCLSNHDLENGKILDIGCGNGTTTEWFSQHAKTYSIGIEINKILPKSSRKDNPRLEYIFASGIRLPFKEKSFHTVILNDVLEHVNYREAAILFNEIKRVLDDQGRVYVSVANKYEVREPHSNLLLISWFPRWIYSPVFRKIIHGDVYPYTTKLFRKIMKETNFASEDFTWYYVTKKTQNLNYIGNTIVRPIVQILNEMSLTSSLGFRRFLEKFAVLVFVCKKFPTTENQFSPLISITEASLSARA